MVSNLIEGGTDTEVIALNEIAFQGLHEPKALEIIPGATHRFSEAAALEQVIEHAARWFDLSCRRNGIVKTGVHDLQKQKRRRQETCTKT